MPKNLSVKSSELSLLSVPAFWPMAMATAMLEQGTELYAKNVKFVEEETRIHGELRPVLATPNKVRLDLRTMVLRDYGESGGIPTLVDAPHAGHTAVIADYHKGQSELCRNLGDEARSGGVVCRRFEYLDAVFESDTCDNLGQVICAFQPPPGFRCGDDQLEHHQPGGC